MKIESFPQPISPQEKQEPVEEKLETGKKVFRFLDRTKFLDVRKSDEQFDKWIQNLSYEDFRNYLTRLNGILREIPIKQRSVDGSEVTISFSLGGLDKGISYLPPPIEQKEELMKETFDAFKEIPNNEDRALLVYYALQSIHLYSDGNGRTGRLLYEIIADSGKELTEEKLSELLDHDKKGSGETGKGRDIFANKVLDVNKAYYLINREVAKEVLGEDFLKENGGIYVASALGVGFLSETTKQKLFSKETTLAEKILGEGDVKNFPFRGIILAKFLRERPDLQKYQYELKRLLDRSCAIPEDVGKKIVGLDLEKLMPNLTEDDARQLIKIHRDVKTKFIRNIIDIFVHPENHQIRTEDGKDVSIKDTFNYNA